MTARITLALLFAVPAAMAYPWQSVFDRWLLGVAVAVMVVLFAWWRGLFLTTILARRIAMLRRRNQSEGSRRSREFATVTLHVAPGGAEDLPLELIAGYADRYGITFHKVRITSRDTAGARDTWVTLTLGAEANIAALTARSPRIPLQDTVILAARRLADHLRESGWEVTVVDDVDVPLPQPGKETWRAVADERGHTAGYRVRVDDHLTDTLAELSALDADELWTALEFTGSRTDPAIAAYCAVRTGERPGAGAPLPRLVPERGRQRPALAALAPDSDERLAGAPVPIPVEAIATLRWPAGTAISRT